MAELPTKKLNPNELLFKEGAIGEIAYILKKGKIEISVQPGEDKIVLAVLKPPAIFGEMALIFKGERRTATAKAVEYAELMQIGKKELDVYLKRSPKLVVHMLNALVERLKATTERVGRVPDKFIGVCEILNLMCIHKTDELFYDKTVRAIAHALNIDDAQVEEKLGHLEDYDLVDIMLDDLNRKTIRIVNRDTFMNKAMKLYQAKGGKL